MNDTARMLLGSVRGFMLRQSTQVIILNVCCIMKVECHIECYSFLNSILNGLNFYLRQAWNYLIARNGVPSSCEVLVLVSKKSSNNAVTQRSLIVQSSYVASQDCFVFLEIDKY